MTQPAMYTNETGTLRFTIGLKTCCEVLKVRMTNSEYLGQANRTCYTNNEKLHEQILTL